MQKGRSFLFPSVLATLGLIALIIAIALVYTNPMGARDPEGSGGSQFPKKIRVAQTGDFLLYAGLYIAQDIGAFERNGLEVSIINTGGDDKSVAAVVSGQAEIGVGDPTFAGIAKQREQDIRFFASVVNGVPFWGITYSEEIVDKYNASSLDGLRVATFPAPSTAYTLQKEMFQSQGIEPNIIEGAFGSLAGILERSEADIGLELEPNVSLLQSQKGAKVLYSLAERYPSFAITGATVRAEFAQENPETIMAFCDALNQAFAFIRSDKRLAVEILSKRFSELPEEVLNSSIGRMTDEGIIPLSAYVDPTGWKNAIALRSAVGDITDMSAAESALDNKICAGNSR